MQIIGRNRSKAVVALGLTTLLFSAVSSATDVNQPWGKAASWYSGRNMVVAYLDGEPNGQPDGHCAYVKTKRVGSRFIVEHGKNCSTRTWKEVKHWKGAGQGEFRLCRTGHWNCVPTRSWYNGAGE